MKGIRGLLEKDFRLFRYQGGKLFLVIAIVGLFLSLEGNMGTNFVSIYITSVMAIYSGSTISYDEAEHGYNCSWMVCWYDLCRNCCNDKTGRKI